MLSSSASCIRKSGIAFSTVAAFFLAAACGPEKTDEGATTATHPLVVGSTVVYEAEVLARTASATGSQVTAETGASAGKYVQLSGTPAAGAWIQFTLTNVEAGSYDLKLLYKSNYNRGIVQASIDGTNQGSSCVGGHRDPQSDGEERQAGLSAVHRSPTGSWARSGASG